MSSSSLWVLAPPPCEIHFCTYHFPFHQNISNLHLKKETINIPSPTLFKKGWSLWLNCLWRMRGLSATWDDYGKSHYFSSPYKILRNSLSSREFIISRNCYLNINLKKSFHKFSRYKAYVNLKLYYH